MNSWQQLLGNITLLLTAAGVAIFLSQDNIKNEELVADECCNFRV
jgi:hypothetical protein